MSAAEQEMLDLEKEMETLAAFSYVAVGKRDPFQPPTAWLDRKEVADEALVGDQVVGKQNRQKEFLESFQLDSLKLVAILFKVGKQQPAAMVQDPEGRGHVVRPGNFIGVNDGRISRISDGEVEIIEPIRRRTGGTSSRTIVLRLSDRNEENADSGSK